MIIFSHVNFIKKSTLTALIMIGFFREFYKGSSFMLDSELPSIMKTFLQGKEIIFLMMMMMMMMLMMMMMSTTTTTMMMMMTMTMIKSMMMMMNMRDVMH